MLNRSSYPSGTAARAWLGGGLGFPATGRKIHITAITIIHFANGQLVHGWNNWDQLGMMQQLGMSPGPVNMDELLEKRG